MFLFYSSPVSPVMEYEPSTKHVLQGRELIDYLVEKTASTTKNALIEREDRRNRRSTMLFSLITFVGISGLMGAAKLFIDRAVQERTKEFHAEMLSNAEQLERKIASMQLEAQALQKLLTDKIEAIADAIDHQVKMQVSEEASRGLMTLKHREQYHALKQFVAEIQEQVAENSFPENLLTAAVDTANQLSDATDIVQEPMFQEMIETLIDLLVRSDRVKDINRVEQATRETCLRSKRIALDLTDHYGQLIVSSPYPVETLQSEYEVFTRYARASRELKYPEKAIMWELFVEYKRTQYAKSPTTDEIVEMANTLNSADLRNFCYHIFLYSHPLHWEHTPDHEGQTLSKLVDKLLTDYPELRATVEQQMATAELRPLIEQLLATRKERQERIDAAQIETAAAPETEPSQTAEETPADNTLRR